MAPLAPPIFCNKKLPSSASGVTGRSFGHRLMHHCGAFTEQLSVSSAVAVASAWVLREFDVKKITPKKHRQQFAEAHGLFSFRRIYVNNSHLKKHCV